jgi:hypothetical protein
MTLKPCGLREGHRQAMAGRFTPGSLRSRIIDSAISAPVLPQDTAASASPERTDSSADHIDVSFALAQHLAGLVIHGDDARYNPDLITPCPFARPSEALQGLKTA